MIAFTLTVVLFFFWLVVGSAVVAALSTRRSVLQGLLLAPAVGIAMTVLPIFLLNQLGLPVRTFGIPLTVVLLAASLGVLWSRRPLWSARRCLPLLRVYLPYFAVFVASILLTGWPMLRFGLDWVSYANDDMANYVLLAHRHLDHAYFDIPTNDALLQGTDYAQFYWIFVVIGERSGAQLILAWVISMTGWTGLQVYMPFILAMNAGLVSAAAALAYQSGRAKLAAFMTAILLAMSSLNSLGALFQLSAQVGGVALLVSAATLLLRPIGPMSLVAAVRHGLLVAIVGSALLVFYPEVTPFLGLSFGLYVLVVLLRRRSTVSFRSASVALGVAAGVGLAVVNLYAFTAINFLARQAVTATRPKTEVDIDQALFPYFLIPSGLANLWGFQPITYLTGEPWLSMSVIVGALLLVAVTAAALVLAWRAQPAAIVTVVMLLLSAQLVRQGVGFGLFKLAMFAQPFLLGVLVAGWFLVTRRTPMRVGPLILVGMLGLVGQSVHVQGSLGLKSGAFADASAAGVNEEFRQLAQRIDAGSDPQLVFDTSLVVAAKLASVYTRGISTHFPSAYFFPRYGEVPVIPFAGPEVPGALDRVNNALKGAQIKKTFPWNEGHEITDAANALDSSTFTLNTVGLNRPGQATCDYLVRSLGAQSILNRRHEPESGNRILSLSDCRSVSDHLIFTDSELGHSYYLNPTPEITALNQIEPDVLFTGRTFMGLGRRLIFQVVNPTVGSRLAVEVTASIKGDGENLLPPAVVIGADRRPMPLIGRGSARVFSDPIEPLMDGSRAFVALDMGVDGQSFPDQRTGLMTLYGGHIPLDRRLLTGHARDISLISAREVDQLAAPTSIQKFSEDLANPDLEYSGIYEDGWISEAAFFGLTQPGGDAHVVVKGSVPLIDDPDFSTELRVLVDGQEVGHSLLRPGAFEVRGIAPPGAGRRRVELRFSELQRLSGRDQRPAAARISFIGFEAAPVMAPPSMLRNVPAELENPALVLSGLFSDGWMAATSSLTLSQPGASVDVVVRGEVPGIGQQTFSTDLVVLVDGREVGKKTLGPGDFELRAPVPAGGAGQRRVELRFSLTQQLPAPDGRQVGALIQSIGFEAPTAVPAAPPAPAGAPAAPPVPVAAQAPAATTTPSGPLPLQAITDPHTDLGNPMLQVTGLDGDRWLAGTASFTLAQPAAPTSLVVRGMVPLVNDPAYISELHILVDGQEVARQTLGLGDFELRVPAPAGAAGQRRVELRFSSTQQLPAPDGRQVGARVTFAGFEAAPMMVQAPTATAVPTPSGPLPPQAITDPHTDLGNLMLQASGLDGDGWLAGTVSFTLAQPATPTSLVVRGMVPLVNDPAYTSELRVLVDGQEAARQTLSLGGFELRAPAPAGGAGQRRVELRFSSTQQLPPPDVRQVGARVTFVGFEGS